nr:reverse transcriptase domain-containing protein [Tanacetum cinerariifolium]
MYRAIRNANTTAFSKLLILSTNEQTPFSQSTSAVWNTLGKEQILQDSGKPASDAALREYYDKNYHQLLPIIANKVHQENVQQEKLKAVKDRLNFEEASQHSESGTPSKRRDLKKRLGSRRICSMSESPEPWRGRFKSARKRDPERKICSKDCKRVYSIGLETRGRESIDSYDDLKKAFLENYLQQNNASKMRSKFTTLSREMGNPWKSFRALQGSKINYTPIKKLILALVTGRLLKWIFELEEHDIHYRPRTSVKGQILTDFIMERLEDDPSDTPMEDEKELLDPWILFTDGSSCIDGSRVDLLLTNLEGMKFTYALRFRFDATNNEAECKALIAGLRIAEQIGVKNLQANVDSWLVANQLNKTYIAKELVMITYSEKVRTIASTFKEFSIKQVPKGENKKADVLSKMASTSFAHMSKQVLVKEVIEKSIDEKEVLALVEEGHTWMSPIYEYLTEEIILEEKRKARIIRRKACRYAVTNEILYKKYFLRPWLRCVGPLQANYVLKEIHEGSCSMHASPRSVVAKALRLGYSWPTMHVDSKKLIRECNSCQVHHPVPRNPQQNLTPFTSPWPFYKWGLDIAGPFPKVSIDYFTKWIKAKPVATITGAQIKKFVCDNMVCKFGLPREIISNNEKKFRDNPFKDWCEKLCIRQCLLSSNIHKPMD